MTGVEYREKISRPETGQGCCRQGYQPYCQTGHQETCHGRSLTGDEIQRRDGHNQADHKRQTLFRIRRPVQPVTDDQHQHAGNDVAGSGQGYPRRQQEQRGRRTKQAALFTPLQHLRGHRKGKQNIPFIPGKSRQKPAALGDNRQAPQPVNRRLSDMRMPGEVQPAR